MDRRPLRFDRAAGVRPVDAALPVRLHPGIGTTYAGYRIARLVDGLDIEIVGLDG
ncbi:MAG TPA: hypothetical protein VGL60_09860 [Acidimicrobiales bacterium]